MYDILSTPFYLMRNLHIILPVVWNANSTIPSSWSAAAKWKTLKIFFHPDLMFAACELTIWATHRTTISRIVGDLKIYTQVMYSIFSIICVLHNDWYNISSHLFFFMICSNGRRKSFWNLKLANSPFSKNFIDNCRKESTAKNAMSSLRLQPTWKQKKSSLHLQSIYQDYNF